MDNEFKENILSKQQIQVTKSSNREFVCDDSSIEDEDFDDDKNNN